MSMERDNQHIIAAQYLDLLTMVDGTVVKSAAIDTQGMRSLSFVTFIDVGGPLDPLDEIHIGAEDSPDGVTFTAVATYKILPTERQLANLMVNPVAPYLQVTGVVSAERYIKLVLTCTNVAARQGLLQIQFFAVMHPENLAFRAWDPDAISDGNP